MFEDRTTDHNIETVIRERGEIPHIAYTAIQAPDLERLRAIPASFDDVRININGYRAVGRERCKKGQV
jgi:hypothetical protein